MNTFIFGLGEKLKSIYRKMTGTHKIVFGFLTIILLGACLLMLPFATRAGETTTFSGALFNSVSATCVTGLVAYDTWTHWTLFGQLVLLTEIQIGGLGFITIGTFAMILMRKKIGISRRSLIHDSLSTLQISGSVRLVRHVIIGTLLMELTGAALLAIRFVPLFGAKRGLYYSIFHAISAFCNAGFDLMGCYAPYSSLTPFYNDPLVILVLSALIIVGGLGFIVWEDFMENGFHISRYLFHTKVVLGATTILLAGGTLLFYLMERGRLFAGMPLGDQLLAALFSAVTPRTAGFNSVDTAQLSGGSTFLTVILMFVGGSPGSTAGGIKTTTLVIILLSIKAYVLREKDCVIFKERLDDESVRKASVVIFINLFLAVIGILVILGQQDLPFKDIVFEVFSAIGTAGMSTGVTRNLNLISKCMIMLLMFCGRMGSLTFAMAFTEHKRVGKLRYPVGRITVG